LKSYANERKGKRAVLGLLPSYYPVSPLFYYFLAISLVNNVSIHIRVFYVTGSLNAHKVYIVAKNRLMADRSGGRSTNAKSSSASQFEQSFRVQVSKISFWLKELFVL
jgi:hypothetical protein